jgi:formamidase
VRVPASHVHNRWHPGLEPVAAVRPGAEITLETRDGIDGQLTSESTHADVLALDLGLGHPLTGPLYVDGAEPGDLLEVELLAFEEDSFGTTAIIPGFGFLADLFTEPYLVKWRIEGGLARAAELPGVAVRGAPFPGVVGVAPSPELLELFRARENAIREAGGPVADPAPETAVPPAARDGLRTIPPRETGGNIDIRQLVAGSRLFLPVHVPGALFSIGDLHFAQGDGEVCGTAIEIAGAVTVRFRVDRGGGGRRFPSYVAPPEPVRGPWLGVTGIPVDAGMDVNAAARAALLEMIDHLAVRLDVERAAAYALCSVAVDLRISEVVDVPYPLVSALLPLDVLESSSQSFSGTA